MVAALGLPVNDLFRYALLLLATVTIFSGAAVRRPARWIAVAVIVALAQGAQMLWPAPQIDEGHNVFIVDRPGGVLERGLPAEAYRMMAAEFDARYPHDRRCAPRPPDAGATALRNAPTRFRRTASMTARSCRGA